MWATMPQRVLGNKTKCPSSLPPLHVRARELARAMDGSITDDDGRSLSDAALQAIARDLQTLYDTLDARDLSAGSPQARRLFS